MNMIQIATISTDHTFCDVMHLGKCMMASTCNQKKTGCEFYMFSISEKMKTAMHNMHIAIFNND